MSRNIIQLLVTGENRSQLVAWCDDGSLWLYDDKAWHRIPQVPQI